MMPCYENIQEIRLQGSYIGIYCMKNPCLGRVLLFYVTFYQFFDSVICYTLILFTLQFPSDLPTFSSLPTQLRVFINKMTPNDLLLWPQVSASLNPRQRGFFLQQSLIQRLTIGQDAENKGLHNVRSKCNIITAPVLRLYIAEEEQRQQNNDFQAQQWGYTHELKRAVLLWNVTGGKSGRIEEYTFQTSKL